MGPARAAGPAGTLAGVGARALGDHDREQAPAADGWPVAPGHRTPDHASSSRAAARSTDAIPPSLTRFSPAPSSPAPSSPAPSTPARSSVPDEVMAALVADAVTEGLRPPPPDGTRDAWADDPAAALRDDIPTVFPRDDAGQQHPRTPLPRLRAAGESQQGRRDRPPAPPEVTVNIGRIEVVPPADPRPPTPPPRPRARAAGAPPLADYLRDRSRR